MAARLAAVDLNRDDKAHNFVVSLNAFQDGNRLAYLALAIAIGIDSLIFMSGLFGANAVRSPLSDVPTMKARNSQQLNAMIETALLPDVFKKARLVSQSMHPVENVDGYSNEVRLDELDPETAVQVRDVLNAGAIIGAVRRADQDGRYLVRSELLEFLNTVIKRQLETNGEDAKRSMELDQLEDQIRVALMPTIGETCEFVMGQLDPINEKEGFTSEVYLDQIAAEKQPPVLNVLNTGATFQVVQRDDKNAERYYVHKDLYKTLARIRAAEFARAGALPRLGGPSRAASFGGALTEDRRAIADHTRASGDLPTSTDPQHLTSELVSALGIDPDLYIHLPGDTFREAMAASEVFQHVRSQNGHLDKALGNRDDEVETAFERAFNRLSAALTQINERAQLPLKNAATDIQQNWGVLMLLPNGPYETALSAIVEFSRRPTQTMSSRPMRRGSSSRPGSCAMLSSRTHAARRPTG